MPTLQTDAYGVRAKGIEMSSQRLVPVDLMLDSAWPLRDIVAKLVDAANILLIDKDYDGHGWELISGAKKRAEQWLTAAPASETNAIEQPRMDIREVYAYAKEMGLPTEFETNAPRTLLSSDAYCPRCGHNRDTSSVSAVSLDDNWKKCQMCGVVWRETNVADQEQHKQESINLAFQNEGCAASVAPAAAPERRKGQRRIKLSGVENPNNRLSRQIPDRRQSAADYRHVPMGPVGATYPETAAPATQSRLPLSEKERLLRTPLRPEISANLLQDQIHDAIGRSRPAQAIKTKDAEVAPATPSKLTLSAYDIKSLRLCGTEDVPEALYQDLCDQALIAIERESQIAELERENAARQAQIDRLMLEFCPAEMSEEQTTEWKRNQRS